MPDRLLVNFFYAQPVGHAIEALHYANGYHAADPDLEASVALNAAAPVELASYCPSVRAAYPIVHPFLEPAADAEGADALAPVTSARPPGRRSAAASSRRPVRRDAG